MLDVNTFLIRGTQYTLALKPSFLSALDFESYDSLTSKVAGLSNLSGAYFHAGTSGLMSNEVDCTFTYSGDGSDVVANIYQQVTDAIDGTFGNYDFVGMTQGAAGTDETGGTPLPTLPSSSYLWAFAALAIIALFVYTGGATATRRALA
jgi:hypothetical protein